VVQLSHVISTVHKQTASAQIPFVVSQDSVTAHELQIFNSYNAKNFMFVMIATQSMECKHMLTSISAQPSNVRVHTVTLGATALVFAKQT